MFFGLDSVLDFRLAEGVFGDENNAPLRDVLKGIQGPQTLFNRLEAQRNRALNRGEIGRYLVTFVDNHDSFWQPSGRFANGATDDQVIGAIGFLLCSLGTPCIYYGTEQGFSGHGGDNEMREAMFDTAARRKEPAQHRVPDLQEIAKIADVMRTEEPLRFGRMYYRQISGDRRHFGFPFGPRTRWRSPACCTLRKCWSPTTCRTGRQDRVVVDATLHPDRHDDVLYGGSGTCRYERRPTAPASSVDLGPHQFVVLK